MTPLERNLLKMQKHELVGIGRSLRQCAMGGMMQEPPPFGERLQLDQGGDETDFPESPISLLASPDPQMAPEEDLAK